MASSATVVPLGAAPSCIFSGFSRSPHLQISTCSRTPRKLQVQASGNSFGTIFRVTTFGESRGGGVGCIVDGCPPRLHLSEADIQRDLDRRRPDLSGNITYRKETDICKIYSGVADGMTTGTPIMISVPNNDQKGHDYDEMNLAYRPSHADATYDFKYGVRSVEGGGRSAARETVGRVAAGAIAKKLLKKVAGTEVLGYVSKVHDVVLPEELVDYESLTFDQIENSIVRCPNPEYAEKMNAVIDAVHLKGDSIGGVVTCIVKNCPRGLGSPVFDKLEALLAQALMSIPASKAFEVGSGFAGTDLTGSQHNDEFFMDKSGRIRTRTNRSGGIQGGISNGEIITMRVAFKPTATIAMKQNTVTRDKREVVLSARGLHDPCILPRAVPVVESMVALVLIDQLMVQCAQGYLLGINPELQDPVPVHSNALADFEIANVE